MNKTKPIAIIILLLSIGITSAIIFSQNKKEQKASTLLNHYLAAGSLENPKERADWELMRLRDPATGKIPAHIRAEELAYAKTLPTDRDVAYNKMGLSATWNQRGPWNVGGRTRAIAFDVTNENIILAGCVSGGVWRSTDGGKNWTKTTENFPGATSIVQDTRTGKTNNWYYASGEVLGTSASGAGADYLGNGIYKSTDGGITWISLLSTVSGTPQRNDSPFDNCWRIAADPSATNSDEVYVAAVSGILRSNNGGNTWTQVLGKFPSGTNPPPYSFYTDVAVTKTGVVYATLSWETSQKGIWRSSDGLNWVNITPVAWPDTFGRVVMSTNPSNENEIYFLTQSLKGKENVNFLGHKEWTNLWKYTYLSGDGTGSGGKWEDRTANIPSKGGFFDRFYTQGSYDMTIKVKSNNVIFLGGTNVYRSTDAFTSDTNTTQIGGYKVGTTMPYFELYPNHHPDIHEFIFLPSDSNVMITASDGGIYKTMDCMANTVTWLSLNDSYMTSQFYTVAIDHSISGNNIIIGGTQDHGNYFTNNANLTTPWTEPILGDGAFCAIPDGHGVYYFSIQQGIIIKTTLDNQGNLISFNRMDPIGGKNYLFINPFVMDPNNNNLMYVAGGNTLWRNDDLSQITSMNNKWDSIATNWVSFPDTLSSKNEIITAVSVSKKPANRVYIGTNWGKVYRVDNANTGTPKPIDISAKTFPNNFPYGAYPSCIAIDPDDADKVMVVFSNYVIQSLFYTADGGTTWTRVSGNLRPIGGKGPSCRWATIMHLNGGTAFFVGTSTGLYATDTLKGTTTVWVQQGANSIGNGVVEMIDTRTSDGLVVVATHGNGVYSAYLTDISQIASVGTQNFVPQLQLQNYPNPFRHSTTIQFNIPQPEKVVLKIYDISGKIIETQNFVSLPAGIHTVSFSAKNLSAGIYYYSIQAGEIREMKKMILIE